MGAHVAGGLEARQPLPGFVETLALAPLQLDPHVSVAVDGGRAPAQADCLGEPRHGLHGIERVVAARVGAHVDVHAVGAQLVGQVRDEAHRRVVVVGAVEHADGRSSPALVLGAQVGGGVEGQVGGEAFAAWGEGFRDGRPGRVEGDGAPEAPTRNPNAIGIDEGVLAQEGQGPEGVGEQHGVGYGHLVFDDARHAAGVEAVNPEHGNAALKPTHHVFVVVPPPAQAAVAGHHTGEGFAAGILGDEQVPKDGLGRRRFYPAQNMVNLEWIGGRVGDQANGCVSNIGEGFHLGLLAGWGENRSGGRSGNRSGDRSGRVAVRWRVQRGAGLGERGGG